MSAAPNNGGPAFPSQPGMMSLEDGKVTPVGFEGMSLRDWFAGQALAGISAELVRLALEDGVSQEVAAARVGEGAVGVAAVAYSLADTMLYVRAAGGQ